jgi:hypothetical protein
LLNQPVQQMQTSRTSLKDSKPVKKTRRGPMLLRHLNNAGGQKMVVGKMVYDPVTFRWEGNEQVLRDFDEWPGNQKESSLAKAYSRPALISHRGFKGPQVVGTMIFDPIQRRWIGNDEDGDVFADIADAIEDKRRVGDGTAHDEWPAAFRFSEKELSLMALSEKTHASIGNAWFAGDRSTSIKDLYKIRRIAEQSY